MSDFKRAYEYFGVESGNCIRERRRENRERRKKNGEEEES
jgi:hypothetical protein